MTVVMSNASIIDKEVATSQTIRRRGLLTGALAAAAFAGVVAFSGSADAGKAEAFKFDDQTQGVIMDRTMALSVKGQSVLIASDNKDFIKAVMTGVDHIAKLTPYDINIVVSNKFPLGDSVGKVIYFANTVRLEGTLLSISSFDGSIAQGSQIANKVAATLVDNHKKYIAPVVVSNVAPSRN